MRITYLVFLAVLAYNFSLLLFIVGTVVFMLLLAQDFATSTVSPVTAQKSIWLLVLGVEDRLSGSQFCFLGFDSSVILG